MPSLIVMYQLNRHNVILYTKLLPIGLIREQICNSLEWFIFGVLHIDYSEKALIAINIYEDRIIIDNIQFSKLQGELPISGTELLPKTLNLAILDSLPNHLMCL